jgi:hypothetical protein
MLPPLADGYEALYNIAIKSKNDNIIMQNYISEFWHEAIKKIGTINDSCPSLTVYHLKQHLNR